MTSAGAQVYKGVWGRAPSGVQGEEPLTGHQRIREQVSPLKLIAFYRAMHFSAKRGIAIACRLSVCLSVCNVGEL